jgi:dTDP-4-dehydrorhamnose reductase
MRVLITGGEGQLGRDLRSALAEHEVQSTDLPELDVTDLSAVLDAFASFRPEVVVHAAALTDTVRCESEPDLAYTVNALGARNVAVACQQADAAMLYVGTNEVFDGARREPYLEFDEPNPLNVYGRSKLAGERFVQTLLARHYVVRTAWLYGAGGANFPSKILAAAGERPELSFVVDEIATPTWTCDLVAALAALIQQPLYGVYHLTNSGACSRFEWAREVLGLAGRDDVALRPVTTAEWRRAGGAGPRKPPYSVLRNFVGEASLGIVLRPWQEALAEYLALASPGGAGQAGS